MREAVIQCTTDLSTPLSQKVRLKMWVFNCSDGTQILTATFVGNPGIF